MTSAGGCSGIPLLSPLTVQGRQFPQRQGEPGFCSGSPLFGDACVAWPAAQKNQIPESFISTKSLISPMMEIERFPVFRLCDSTDIAPSHLMGGVVGVEPCLAKRSPHRGAHVGGVGRLARRLGDTEDPPTGAARPHASGEGAFAGGTGSPGTSTGGFGAATGGTAGGAGGVTGGAAGGAGGVTGGVGAGDFGLGLGFSASVFFLRGVRSM